MKLRWRKIEEKIFLAVTGLVAILVASILIWIIGQIAWNALPVINPHFLLTSETDELIHGHAIANAIAGTIIISLTSVMLATPLSVATAIYMKRYAKDNAWTRALGFLVDVLSGTPSIIMGVFGYLMFVYYFRSITGGFSLISGSIALAILIIPVIEKGTESAIDTVPHEYEHASYALGSNLWQTIRGITIPYALPGIVTGIILGIGRACEESAVVIMTAGYSQHFPFLKEVNSNQLLFGIKIYPLQDVVATLPITIYNDFEQSNLVSPSYAFGAAFVLIAIVMLINLSARIVLWRFRMGAKRMPLFPVVLTAGGRKILKLPIIAKVTPRITGTDGDGNENKFGKLVRWFTTDPKKKAKEKEDAIALVNASEAASPLPVYDNRMIKENTVVDTGQPDKSIETESSIYSPETSNKAIEAMDRSDAPMPESTSYSPESEPSTVTLEPAEENSGENGNTEPEPKINKPPEPLPVKETDEAWEPNGDDDKDKVGKFVKWLTTDPKKEAGAKKADSPVVQHTTPQQTPSATPGQPEGVSNTAVVPKSGSGLEVIPPAAVLRGKTKSEANPNLVVYPSVLPSVIRETGEVLEPGYKKDDNKAGGLVKWLLTDPKKEAAKKKVPAAIKAETQPAPAAPTVSTQEQSSRPSTQPGSDPRGPITVSHPDDSSDIANTEVDRKAVIFPPPSPPSEEEIRDTLGNNGKKSGKAGGVVKWLLTDSMKESAAKAKSAGASGTAAERSIDKLYSTDGGAGTKTKTSKVHIPLPNIFGGGSSKQKNSNEMLEFNVGKLSQPAMEGSIKDTDFTYAIDPPFQYVRIFFDGEELVYNVLEPALSDQQKRYMAIIERGLEKLISSKIVAIKPEEREQFLRQKFDEIIDMYSWKLDAEYRDRMFYYLYKRYLGYDRIDIIMKDHFIEDISCNGPNAYVYIFHRIYGSVRTNVSYGDVELNKFVMRMAQISGRHISILQPIKDISLPDGSRANLTLGTEVTKKGATFTIRKFKDRPISPIELMEYSSIDSRALAYLWTLLDYKRSILVSGGTASGKTTLMNVLCAFIRPELKIVSLEDTPELNLVHPNWIQSVTRSGFGAESGGGAESVSGVSGISAKSPGNIGLYDLLVAALRQRPEYIIVGEVRGAEAFTLFQAIAVGHAAMGTIHAGNMRELLSRVESNPMNVPRTLFAAMDVVCFSAMVRRGDRNVRRVMQIVEILELDTEGNLITNPVFRWDAVSDRFIFTGKSHIFEKIEAQLGIRQESLIKEMDNRAAFLQELRHGGVRDYTTVVENIREYELNKITGDHTS